MKLIHGARSFLNRIGVNNPCKRFFADGTSEKPKKWDSGVPTSYIVGSITACVAASCYFLWTTQDPKDIPLAPHGTLDIVPEDFRSIKVLSVHKLSDDTKKIRFALNDHTKTIDVPDKSTYVLTRVTDPKDPIHPTIRPYTPVSGPEDKGYFDLVVKAYPDGVMSKHIHQLIPGDVLDMKGPLVKYDMRDASGLDEAIFLMGGTGITPGVQVINKILSDPQKNNTKLTLLYGSRSEDDILLKDEIDKIAAKNPDRLKVVYLVDKPKNQSLWVSKENQLTGYINKDLLQNYIPKPTASKLKIFICGPPPMVNSISGSKAPDYSQGELKGILKEMGYTKDQVFKF